MSKTDMKNNIFGKSKDGCPDEEMLGLFVGHSLDESEMASTAIHVIGCDRCKEFVKEHVKRLDSADATDEERDIVRFALMKNSQEWLKALWDEVFAAFKPTKCCLAAADGQTGDQIQQGTVVESGFVHFVSAYPAACDAWHITLAIPTVITGVTRLRFNVQNFKEDPIESGTLVFCGVPIDITHGLAHIPIKTFRENIHVPMIALKTADGKIISGKPVRVYMAGPSR